MTIHSHSTHAHAGHSHSTHHPPAKPNPLVGIWRLVSSETTMTDGGKTEVLLAKQPKGYLIITAEGRMMTVSIGSARKKIPTSNADLTELWKTMMAYTGTYRVEGEYFVTSVDVSWYEVWTGTEQRRKYKLEDDRLTIVTTPQPVGAGRRAKALISSKVVWERDK